MMHLAVIKAVRACNLRCPYCYYINEDTPNYGMMIREETLRKFYSAVAEHIGPEDHFEFVWHGGEPLLLGKARFRRFVEIQKEYLAARQCINVMQTNGTLITPEWCDVLSELGVGVGVSLDGPPEVHNRRRPKVRGAGSYDEVLQGIRLLQERGGQVGVLCVADPLAHGDSVLSHFSSLGIPWCDLLIPISNNCLAANNDVFKTDHQESFGLTQYFIDAFSEWVNHRKNEISVRLFDSFIQNAFGILHGDLNAGSNNIAENLILETDGQVCLDPDFWYVDRFSFGKAYRLDSNVHDNNFSLDQIAAKLDLFAKENGLKTIPSACQSCAMRSVCRGSHPASRFGDDGSFDHRSAYCNLTYPLANAVVSWLAEAGLSSSLIDQDLRRTVVNHYLNAA